MPHGFHVSEQRAERSRGPYATDEGIIALLMYLVGLVSTETTGLTP